MCYNHNSAGIIPTCEVPAIYKDISYLSIPLFCLFCYIWLLFSLFFLFCFDFCYPALFCVFVILFFLYYFLVDLFFCIAAFSLFLFISFYIYIWHSLCSVYIVWVRRGFSCVQFLSAFLAFLPALLASYDCFWCFCLFSH